MGFFIFLFLFKIKINLQNWTSKERIYNLYCVKLKDTRREVLKVKWLKQLSQVIDYIENNLDGVISYDEAAKIACCSTYYFQRIFSYITGITLSEYIRRRRMTKAAFELETTNKKVMNIGLKYGYKSPTAFNRAFQSVHGVSPTAARTQGTLLNAYLPISFSISVTGGENMSYRIETKEAIRIVGVRTALQEDMEQNQKIAPAFWNKMLKGTVLPEICKLAKSGGNYTAFILPGIMVLVTLVCCSSGGYINFIMKSKGSFYRILIAPVKRSSVVLGQILEAVLVSFIEVAIMLVLSIFLSVRISSGFIGFLMILPLMSGLCYAISLCLPNEVIYETFMNLIVLSIFFASTALFPIDSISGCLKIVVMINPFTHIINCLRSLILGTFVDWQNLLFVTALFICLCCGSFVLALWRLKKETIE